MKKITMALMILAFTAPAFARDRSLLDGALSDSFKDRDQVQRHYKKNDIGLKEKRRGKEVRRIKIEVGDEFGSANVATNRGEESLRFRNSNAADDDIKVNVDQEIKDVNASVSKELNRHPSKVLDGGE